MVIAGIEGTLRSLGDGCAVVDVGGISFRLLAPTSTLSLAGSPGEKVRLLTHLQVRDDSLTLYGFATPDELKLFELLISVSGVGPKVALAVLSTLSAERLAGAVASGNDSLLDSVPGVGKKTAARIVLELRGKFEQTPGALPHAHQEVRAALISLGYSAAEATAAVAGLPDSPGLALEDKIRLALQHFARVR